MRSIHVQASTECYSMARSSDNLSHRWSAFYPDHRARTMLLSYRPCIQHTLYHLLALFVRCAGRICYDSALNMQKTTWVRTAGARTLRGSRTHTASRIARSQSQRLGYRRAWGVNGSWGSTLSASRGSGNVEALPFPPTCSADAPAAYVYHASIRRRQQRDRWVGLYKVYCPLPSAGEQQC